MGKWRVGVFGASAGVNGKSTSAQQAGLVRHWLACKRRLEEDLPAQQFNTWLRPLQASERDGGLLLLAPNRFVSDWVREKYLGRIVALLGAEGETIEVSLVVGSQGGQAPVAGDDNGVDTNLPAPTTGTAREARGAALNRKFTFETFVEGGSNRLAKAAAIQVSESDRNLYNPLLIYGGVGLGKTHLVHACGNEVLARKPDARVVYLHSERFVSDMVSALQRNAIDSFKSFYRSIDVLLIDDIQFLAGKERSQEEFFHVFNALVERENQIVMTSDRYPKQIKGLEDRLKSRFGWGLTVAIEPPDLETRVAIIKHKADMVGTDLPDEVGFFIARSVFSNVRELEGALRRILALANFTGRPVSLEVAREALRDLIASNEQQVSLESIQRAVARYFDIRQADLLSKSRRRVVTRPRQIAMALAKELTNLSLPTIGEAFGGRDHSTVLHACDRVRELRSDGNTIDEDYRNLVRILTG